MTSNHDHVLTQPNVYVWRQPNIHDKTPSVCQNGTQTALKPFGRVRIPFGKNTPLKGRYLRRLHDGFKSGVP